MTTTMRPTKYYQRIIQKAVNVFVMGGDGTVTQFIQMSAELVPAYNYRTLNDLKTSVCLNSERTCQGLFLIKN